MPIKRNLLFLTALGVISLAFVFSQDYKGKGRVTGYVYDEKGQPLAGVTVKLLYTESQSGYSVETDKDGKWTGNWLRSGAWNIDFEKTGYLPDRINIRVREHDRNPDVEIRLKKSEAQAVAGELKSLIIEGNRLYEEGKWEEALETFRSVLEKSPNATILNRSIGNVYFQMGRYEEAIVHYQRVFENSPDDYETMVLIGNTYSNMGQDEKAMEWYNKIPLNQINDAKVLFNIGANFYEKTKLNEAVKYFQKAVAVQGEFLDAIFQLGLSYSALGSYKEAMEVFETYIKKDPDSERGKQASNFLEFLKKKS